MATASHPRRVKGLYRNDTRSLEGAPIAQLEGGFSEPAVSRMNFVPVHVAFLKRQVRAFRLMEERSFYGQPADSLFGLHTSHCIKQLAVDRS